MSIINTSAAEKLVRVYNRGQRSFLHAEHKLHGGAFAEVPRAVAENWLKMFPNDVIEAAVAQKELGGLGAELAETKTRLESAEDRIKKLDAILATKTSDPKGEKARADLTKALERITELENQLLEKQTAPAPAVEPSAADRI